MPVGKQGETRMKERVTEARMNESPPRVAGVYACITRDRDACRDACRERARARESMDEFKSRIFASASWNPTPPSFINDTLRNRDSHPDWNGT